MSPPSIHRNPSYEMAMPLPPNGMYPPPARDYHPPPADPSPSTYHQTHTQAYNPYPLPGAAFNHNTMMPPVSSAGPEQHSNYLNPSRPGQAAVNVVGPSPDSILTTSTPRSGQNNLDLSEYLDPTDKVEPKLPFFQNNPSTSKAHPSSNEDDAVASGRISDGEDPGKWNWDD